MPNQEYTPSKLMSKKSMTGLYRSKLTSPEKRRSITVSRQDMLDDTLERLRGSIPKQSKPHFLFIGPRGIGKSHFLSLIEDTIDEDKTLSSAFHVVRFPEEANRLLSFADFLLGVVEILQESLPDEPIWRELFAALSTEEDDAKIIDTLVPALRRENKKHKRTLLIMLENLNQIFSIKMRKQTSVASMRKFFMDHNHCMLMATSPTYFSAITSVDEPFYDFFDTQLIRHLSEEETIALIRKNLEWEDHKDLLAEFDSLRPKLRAIYQMTAGNPRLTMMLYELIAHDAITQVREQLDALLDRITPFYQDRLNDLPAQEQALLETMATMRDTEKTPAAIAARMRMKPQQISSLLKRLTDSLYLRAMPHPNDKRSRLYNIREGFFDIWLAMNVSRAARNRVPYLLNFFAAFYPTLEERDKKRRELHKKLQEEADPNAETGLNYLSEVGADYEKVEAKIKLATHYAAKGEQDKARSFINESRKCTLDPVGKWIVEHANTTTDYLGEIEQLIQCWQTHRSGNLEAFAKKMLTLGASINYLNYSETKLAFLSDQLALLPANNDKIKLRLKIASIFSSLAQFDKAEEQLRKAKDEVSEDSQMFSVILNDLAQLLQATNRLDEAEPLMRRALEIDEASYGKDHPEVAIDLNNLARLLYGTNRLDEAEPLMRRALLIFLKFTASTSHRHPYLLVVFGNYAKLCGEMGIPKDEIIARLATLKSEAGMDDEIFAEILAEVFGNEK